MDLEKIERLAEKEMEDRVEHTGREPGWILAHGRRVAKLAVWLADELSVDVDRHVLYTAGLFHDIGKGEPDHQKVGARQAGKLLKRSCTEEELGQIVEMIEAHNQRGEQGYSTGALIIQDADVLDHVGPIGAMLMFYWNGQHEERFSDLCDYVGGETARGARQEMRASLNFELSRLVFDRRVAYEDELVDILQKVYQEGRWTGDVSRLERLRSELVSGLSRS